MKELDAGDGNGGRTAGSRGGPFRKFRERRLLAFCLTLPGSQFKFAASFHSTGEGRIQKETFVTWGSCMGFSANACGFANAKPQAGKSLFARGRCRRIAVHA